jgi:sirohydrochlorin ferrochelatase
LHQTDYAGSNCASHPLEPSSHQQQQLSNINLARGFAYSSWHGCFHTLQCIGPLYVVPVFLVQAIHTAADLARIHKSKVTVLVVDHKGEGGDPAVKMQVINK